MWRKVLYLLLLPMGDYSSIKFLQYKHKVVSCNIAIIHVSGKTNVYNSKCPSHGWLGLMVLPPAYFYMYGIGCGPTIGTKCLMPWISAVI
jgi:hypothetical protein